MPKSENNPVRDLVREFLRRHKKVAAVVLVGTGVVALGTFTEAVGITVSGLKGLGHLIVEPFRDLEIEVLAAEFITDPEEIKEAWLQLRASRPPASLDSAPGRFSTGLAWDRFPVIDINLQNDSDKAVTVTAGDIDVRLLSPSGTSPKFEMPLFPNWDYHLPLDLSTAERTYSVRIRDRIPPHDASRFLITIGSEASGRVSAVMSGTLKCWGGVRKRDLSIGPFQLIDYEFRQAAQTQQSVGGDPPQIEVSPDRHVVR